MSCCYFSIKIHHYFDEILNEVKNKCNFTLETDNGGYDCTGLCILDSSLILSLTNDLSFILDESILLCMCSSSNSIIFR